MDSRLHIACIGAGRRFETVYLPVLQKLSPMVELVGFTRRQEAVGQEQSKRLGIPFYPTLDALVEHAKPDVLLVMVPPKANAEVTRQAIAKKCAVLIETPVALNLSQAKHLKSEVTKHGATVGVMEQKPFLPLEEWKHVVIESGVLGQIVVVVNDFRSYDYHGIAQLRRYLSPDAKPKQVTAVSRVVTLPPYQSKQAGAKTTCPTTEVWQVATVTCTNDSLLLHHMTSAYKTAPFRTIQSLRVSGEKGSIIDDVVTYIDSETGETVTGRAMPRYGSMKELLGVDSILSNGKKISWINPYSFFNGSDDEISIASHLLTMVEVVRGRGEPRYSLDEAIIDLKVMEAIRLSAAKEGRPVFFSELGPWSRLTQYFSWQWWKQTGQKIIGKMKHL